MRSKRRRKTRRHRRRKRRGRGKRNPRAQERLPENPLEVPHDGKPYTAKTPIPEKRKTVKRRGNLTTLMRRDSNKSFIVSGARKQLAENKKRPGILRDQLLREERHERKRREEHAEAQKAAEELTITEFGNMLLKNPSITLDEAILIFENAPEGQTLEEFAITKMRTAESYRNTNRKFFKIAQRRVKDISNLDYFYKTRIARKEREARESRKKRGGRRTRRRKRGGKSPPPAFKSKSQHVSPPNYGPPPVTRSQTKRSQEAAQGSSGLSLMQMAMEKARRKRFQRMAKKQKDRGAAGGRRRRSRRR